MYIPQHFMQVDTRQIQALIEAAPLACVVAHTEHGLIANHLPLYAKTDEMLVGHCALANDMHRVIADDQAALAIFRGPDAYVSPQFYPTKPEHHRHVPTWNYEAVHIHGRIRFQHDARSKRAAVGLLTREHEQRLHGSAGWKMADAPIDYMEQMLDAIVAFTITIDRTLAKSKLSQNREVRDYHGAIEGLDATGHHTLAQQMRNLSA